MYLVRSRIITTYANDLCAGFLEFLIRVSERTSLLYKVNHVYFKSPKSDQKKLNQRKDLLGAARGFIGRVEIYNNRLPFILLQAHRLSILIL